MSMLFPRWSDSVFKLGLLAVVGIGAFGVVLPMLYVRTPYNQNREFPVEQPVQFDHRHHVQDDGIDCRFCHGTVEIAASAGIPSAEVCMGCHVQIWPTSGILEPVRRSYFSGLPIRWNRVHELPDFVYFNHAIHVNKGVGCMTCHGRVDRMGLDFQVAPLTMGWCLDCHRDPAPNLRPRAEITSMTWQPAGDPADQGRQLAVEYKVRSLTNCSTCHR